MGSLMIMVSLLLRASTSIPRLGTGFLVSSFLPRLHTPRTPHMLLCGYLLNSKGPGPGASSSHLPSPSGGPIHAQGISDP